MLEQFRQPGRKHRHTQIALVQPLHFGLQVRFPHVQANARLARLDLEIAARLLRQGQKKVSQAHAVPAARVAAIRLVLFNLLISVFMFMLVGKLSKVDYSTCIW